MIQNHPGKLYKSELSAKNRQNPDAYLQIQKILIDRAFGKGKLRWCKTGELFKIPDKMSLIKITRLIGKRSE